MKKYINTLFVMCFSLFLCVSCENDAELTTLQTVIFPAAVVASPSTILLTEVTADETAVTISWPAVVFPIAAPVTYAVQFDIVADISGTSAWSKAKRIEVGDDVLSKSFSVRDLNKIATDFGLQPDVAGKLVVRVEATMDRKIYSDAILLTITPYAKSVVFGEIYMLGSYQGWAVETAAALTAIENGIYQGYMTVPDGAGLGFKLNTARNWAEFYGADGADNIKKMSDTDLVLPGTGSYQVKANLNTLKWSATAYSWGIIGSGTPGSWDNSTKMAYDHVNKKWTVTAALIPGALKFRLNNSWSVNYGQKESTSGIAYLDDQGAHTISEAGTYEITFTINEVDPASTSYPPTATYTVTKLP